MQTRVGSLLVLGLSVTLAACPRGIDEQAPLSPMQQGSYQMQVNGVGLLEPALQKSLVVEANGARRTPTNSLEVYVTFRNRLDAPARITARTRFMDAEKRPIDETQWTEVFLERRGMKNYSAVSKSAEASYYYVEVQPAR